MAMAKSGLPCWKLAERAWRINNPVVVLISFAPRFFREHTKRWSEFPKAAEQQALGFQVGIQHIIPCCFLGGDPGGTEFLQEVCSRCQCSSFRLLEKFGN